MPVFLFFGQKKPSKKVEFIKGWYKNYLGGNNARMIKNNHSLSEAKEAIKNMHKKDVEVTLNLGRNKIVRFCGELEGVYPALFKVRPHDNSFKGKTTYSYSEYLCGRVKLTKIEKTLG